MISPLWASFSPIRQQAAKMGSDSGQLLLLSSFGHGLSLPESNFRASFKCRCIKKEIQDKPVEGFSVLTSDIPWGTGSIWSTLAIYMFNLHIPLGYGGLSIVTYILHQPILKPETEAWSLLILQVLELTGALFLLRAAKRNCGISFNANKSANERNWLLASALGFGLIISLVFLTSILSDKIVGIKAVNSPVVKEILQSSLTSRAACVLVYCFITPVLEETIYRWFLLTSLASSTMDWRYAVLISSAVFSAAHFSGENFLSLFIIGCVLGCSYSWTGKLRTPIVIHSLYNAFTLVVTFLS